MLVTSFPASIAMLQQIPLKQRYKKKNAQKLQAKKRKELQKLVKKNKGKLLSIISIITILLIWLIIQQFYFKHSNFSIQEIVDQKEYTTFFDTSEISTFVQLFTGTSYWKTKNSLEKEMKQGPQGERINEVEIIDYEQRTLIIDTQYHQPEIIFINGTNKRATKDTYIVPVISGSTFENRVPEITLPNYHTGSIAGIFHKVSPERILERHQLLESYYREPTIEFHPGINKFIVYSNGEKIIFDLLEESEVQLEKYTMIQDYFSGTVIKEFDLSSAPYAIIKQ